MLIVDDVADNRELLAELLGTVGFEVEQTGDGEAAIDRWQQWRPQLIWMDQRMAPLDGLAVTRRIRALERAEGRPPVVIIALSASVLEHERAEVLRNGCDDFVAKPIREAEILAKMAQHLGVRYRYQAAMTEASASGASSSLAVTPDRLARLPNELLVALRAALAAGDIRQAQTLSEAIAGHDPALGTTIRDHLDGLRLDELEGLLG